MDGDPCSSAALRDAAGNDAAVPPVLAYPIGVLEALDRRNGFDVRHAAHPRSPPGLPMGPARELEQ